MMENVRTFIRKKCLDEMHGTYSFGQSRNKLIQTIGLAFLYFQFVGFPHCKFNLSIIGEMADLCAKSTGTKRCPEATIEDSNIDL